MEHANTFVVGDMPFGSYQVSDELAVQNACTFLKKRIWMLSSLKGEGACTTRIGAIVDSGIVVCGHIGLTPRVQVKWGVIKHRGGLLKLPKRLSRMLRAVRDAGASLC